MTSLLVSEAEGQKTIFYIYLTDVLLFGSDYHTVNTST